MGIAGQLAKGAAWVGAARLVVNMAALAGTLVLARILGPDAFGLVAIATTILAIVQALTELSLSQAIIQHKKPDGSHYDTAFTLNLIRALVVAGALAAASAPLAEVYDDPRLGPVLIAVAASVVLIGLQNPRTAMLDRQLVFWQEFAFGVSNRVTNLIVSVAVALLTGSYWALVAGLLAGQCAALVVGYVIIAQRPRLCLSRWRDLLSFSVWLSLGQAVKVLNWRFDQLAIGYLLGPATLGLYALGDRLASLPTRETAMPVARTVFPGFSQLRDDPARLRRAYQRAQSFLTAVALPLGCTLALIADPLVVLLLGERWSGAAIVVQVLATIFALQTMGSTVQPVAMALGGTRALFLRDVTMLCVRIPLLTLGLITGGLLGALVARAVSGTIGIGVNMALVRRLTNISVMAQLRVNVPTLVAAACLVLAASATKGAVPAPSADLAATVAAGLAAYISARLAIWLIRGRPDGVERDALRMAGGARRSAQRVLSGQSLMAGSSGG